MAGGSDPAESGDGSGADTEPGGALVTTRPAGPGPFDTDRTPPSLPTTLLERYQIKRVIGTGGMGLVYEALDRNLHRIVALKVLKLVDEDPKRVADAANRLVREARAMAVLSHRNVVTVYDVGMHDSQVYVAMQLVDGATLREWLAAAPRTPSQILRVLCDAGAGLAAAHAARLIHRDFKPDNVLVSRRGTARVTDFGLARRASFDVHDTLPERTSRPQVMEPQELEHVTRSGAILGTPAYMPPEQTEGRACDARADQFSFCVTAWEALYGRRPFAGTSWSEIYSNVVSGNISEPDARFRVVRMVEKALRRGLSADPADRFTSMDELLAVLETGIGRRTTVARFVAIGVASAAVAVAITWFAKERSAPAPTPNSAAAPVAESVPAAPPPAEPTPTLGRPLDPPRAPPIASSSPSIVKVKPRADRRPAAEPAPASASATTEPAPATTAPAKPAPNLDQVRTQRAAFAGLAARRGLRASDYSNEVTNALAEADRAIAAADGPHAQQALDAARTALAAIVIDRAFVNAKLARFNKSSRVPAGREEEFRAEFTKLKTMVAAGKYDDANRVLNELSDRLTQ